VTEDAPAKVNLCLFLGPTREDGRHELVSVFEPLTLADRVTLEPAPGAGGDEVVCPGVEGPNLAADALAAFRAATGWDAPAVRLTIDKRIPVAAGLGGGSSDAAAALRLAARASGQGDDALLLELAGGLGSDVPVLVRPRRTLATGAGERLEPLPAPEPYGLLVLPSTEALSTGAVYDHADRLGLPRDADALRTALDGLRDGGDIPAVNDLEPAARDLCPAIDEALATLRGAGAERAMVAGSGPTVFGTFASIADAERAAERLSGRVPAPIVAAPRRDLG
jgi:4-diphosphocytidyl-2-C-methyl-D-erythritol kinase